MQNDTPFTTTRQDLQNLKQTAVDAAKDLRSTAAVHAQKAKGQLNDLAGHAKEEANDQLEQAKVNFRDVVKSSRDYVAGRPIASVGVALGIGMLLGMAFRGSKS